MQPEPEIPVGLPRPDDASLRHSRRVADFVRQQISAAGGAISFGEFMQHALYAPGLGYYAAGAAKFGASGDFVTAPEVSPLFGRVIAAQCEPVMAAIPGACILELGAGSGALAVALLGRLAELDALPERYLILEVSADLIDRQRSAIRDAVPHFAAKVVWIDSLPSAFDGIVIANEVADALPVERFVCTEGAIRQIYVAANERGFYELEREATPELLRRVRDIEAELGRPLGVGYRSEVSLGLPDWITGLVDSLHSGLILLFDYGVPQSEYYGAERGQGWVRCHFRHHAHNEPLIYPGIQDITAWVDFSAIAVAASHAGAGLAGFVTQAMFLLNGGLDNEFADFAARPVAEQVELARQAKLLTLPTEMGEHFKCLGLSRGDVPIPQTFASGNRMHTL